MMVTSRSWRPRKRLGIELHIQGSQMAADCESLCPPRAWCRGVDIKSYVVGVVAQGGSRRGVMLWRCADDADSLM